MDELRGWKEIGAYFDVTARTAQRWEREYGMPVRRTGRTRGASVFALRADLDHWRLSPNGVRASSEGPEAADEDAAAERVQTIRRFSLARLAVATALVLVAVAVILALRSRTPVAPQAGRHSIVEGYAAPSSSAVLRLQVTTPDTGAILFNVFDGGMATIAIRGGVKLGLVADTATGKGRLAVYQVTAGPSGDESIKELKTMPFPRFAPVHLVQDGVQMDVEWIGSVEASSIMPARDAPPPRCCVICENLTLCAAQVSGVCGNCCGYDGCRKPR